MTSPLNLREETALLQGLLEQALSIEEGLNTPEDLPPYLDAMCDQVVAAGYEVPESFELKPFIEGIESLLNADKSIDESFLRKAVGAVKGAMARGLAKLPAAAHAKLRKYHGDKATAALDAGDDKAYIHHYKAKHFHQKHANPEAAKADAANAKAYGMPKPGTSAAARKTLWHSKQTTRTAKAQSKEKYKDIRARRVAARDSIDVDEPVSKVTGLEPTVISTHPSAKTVQATSVTKKSR